MRLNNRSKKKKFGSIEENEKILKVGDIIFLEIRQTVTDNNDQNAKEKIVKGLISSTGVESNVVFLISIQNASEPIPKYHYKYSLFRIESNPITKRILLDEPEPKLITKIFQTTKENDEVNKFENLICEKMRSGYEKDSNSEEIFNADGNTITYGESIILRHILSNLVLTIVPHKFSKHEYGCLSVTLSPLTEFSSFKIIPATFNKNEGEMVDIEEPFYLTGGSMNSVYYLHGGGSIKEKKIIYPENILELNMSRQKSQWQAKLFASYQEKIQPNYIKAGDIIRLKHCKAGGYFVAEKEFTPLLLTERSEKEPSAEIVHEFCLSSEYHNYLNSFWEIERDETINGHCLRQGDYFRLRHVRSGNYLNLNSGNELELFPNSWSLNGLFSFKKIRKDNEVFYFSNHETITIRNQNKGLLSILRSNTKKVKWVKSKIGKNYGQFSVEKQSPHINRICVLSSSFGRNLFLKRQPIELISYKSINVLIAIVFSSEPKIPKIISMIPNNMKKSLVTLIKIAFQIVRILESCSSHERQIAQNILFQNGILEEMFSLLELIRRLSARSHFLCTFFSFCKILYEMIKSNPQTSRFLIHKHQFFSKDYYQGRSIIDKLFTAALPEASQNLEFIMEEEWGEQLEPIRFGLHVNLCEQVFYIKLLSLMCKNEDFSNEDLQSRDNNLAIKLKMQKFCMNKILEMNIINLSFDSDYDANTDTFSPYFCFPFPLTDDFLAQNPYLDKIKQKQKSTSRLDDLSNNSTINFRNMFEPQSPGRKNLHTVFKNSTENVGGSGIGEKELYKFYLKDFHDDDEEGQYLIDYISAILEFYRCFSEGNNVGDDKIKELGIHFMYIFHTLGKNDINPKIQKGFANLARCLVKIDFTSILRNQIKIVNWNTIAINKTPLELLFENLNLFRDINPNYELIQVITLFESLIPIDLQTLFPNLGLSKGKSKTIILHFPGILDDDEIYFEVTPVRAEILLTRVLASLEYIEFKLEFCSVIEEFILQCLKTCTIIMVSDVHSNSGKLYEDNEFSDHWLNVVIKKGAEFPLLLDVIIQIQTKALAIMRIIATLKHNAFFMKLAQCYRAESSWPILSEEEFYLLSYWIKEGNTSELLLKESSYFVVRQLNSELTLFIAKRGSDVNFNLNNNIPASTDTQKLIPLDFYLLNFIISIPENKYENLKDQAISLNQYIFKAKQNFYKDTLMMDVLFTSTEEALYNEYKAIYLKLLMIRDDSFSHKKCEELRNVVSKLCAKVTLLNNDLLPKYQTILRHSKIPLLLLSMIFSAEGRLMNRTIIWDCLKFIHGFIFRNSINQVMISSYIEPLLELPKKGFNVSKIIRELLRSIPDQKIIIKIFEYASTCLTSFSNHTDRIEESLKISEILLTLIHFFRDSQNSFQQITCAKLLISHLTIKNSVTFVTKDLDDFEKYFVENPDPLLAEEIKIHLYACELLAQTADNCYYGKNQNEDIAPLSSILSVFACDTIPFKFKRVYLNLIDKTYLENEDLDLDSLFTLLSVYLYPDLKAFQNYALPKGTLESMDDDMTSFQDSDLGNEEEKIDRFQKHKLEYWDYLSSDKHWNTSRFGLLNFLLSLLKAVQKVKVSDRFQRIILKFKHKLQKLRLFIQNVNALEDIHLTIHQLLGLINELQIEKNDNYEAEFGYRQYRDDDEKNVDPILKTMNDFLVRNNLSFGQFMNIFDKNNDGEIDIVEFNQALKMITTIHTSIEQVEKTFCLILGSPKIHENLPISYLKRQFINFNENYKNDTNNIEYQQRTDEDDSSYLINWKYKKFLKSYINSLKELNVYGCIISEISELIRKGNDKRKISYLISKMKQSLDISNSVPNQMIFMNIFTKLLEIFSKEEKVREHEILQHALQENQLEIILADLVASNKIQNMTEKGIDLFNGLVQHNIKASQRVLNVLKTHKNTASFLATLRDHIHFAINNLWHKLEKNYKEESFLQKNESRKAHEDDLVVMMNENQNDEDINIVIKILRLLQNFCYDCFNDFQLFMISQGSCSSINLCYEVGMLLICLQKFGSRLFSSSLIHEANKLIPQLFGTLISFTMGNCIKTKLQFGSWPIFLGKINELLSLEVITFECHGEKSLLPAEIFLNCLILLLSLLHRETTHIVGPIILAKINLHMLMEKMILIYLTRIKFRKTIYNLKKVCSHKTGCTPRYCKKSFLTKYDFVIFECGFNIFILLTKLQKVFPSHPILQDFRLNFNEYLQLVYPEEFSYPNLIEKRAKNMLKFRNTRLSEVRSKCSKIYHYFMDPKTKSIFSEGMYFFASNTSTVEINVNNNLEEMYFEIPSYCKYLSRSTRNTVLFKANRISQQAKLEDFNSKLILYRTEMLHRQKLAKKSLVLFFLASYWEQISNLSLIVVILTNIFMLIFYYESDEDTVTTEHSWFPTFKLFTTLKFIQFFLAIGIYGGYTLAFYPTIHLQNRPKNKYQEIVKKKNIIKGSFVPIHGKESLDYLNIKEKKKKERIFTITDAFGLMKDFKYTANLIYLLISILAMFMNTLFYSILLLDIVSRWKTLSNVLSAIGKSYKSLLQTLMFTIFVIFIYSTIAFYSFRGDYEKNDSTELYCDNLFYCFVTTLNYGLRSGGGIGEVLNAKTQGEDNYWARYIFDLTFFVVVLILLMNILFGIIIDSFADMRDQTNIIKSDIKEKCFICGIPRFQFQTKGKGWLQHISSEHNVFSYIYFLMCIKDKSQFRFDLTANEKFVKNCLGKSLTTFYPINKSIQFNPQEVTVEAEDEPKVSQIDETHYLIKSFNKQYKKLKKKAMVVKNNASPASRNKPALKKSKTDVFSANKEESKRNGHLFSQIQEEDKIKESSFRLSRAHSLKSDDEDSEEFSLLHEAHHYEPKKFPQKITAE